MPEDQPDCSAVLCLFEEKSIRIKYLDKTTNKPLLGPGSQYTIDELTITRSLVTNYPPSVKLDVNDPTVVIVTPLMGGEVLTLGNLSADKITFEGRARGKECCAGFDITSLKINDETVCAPCNDLNEMVAVIKK